MGRQVQFSRIPLSIAYWSTALGGATAGILATRSTAAHVVVVAAAFCVLGASRGLLAHAQRRQLAALRAAILRSPWGRRVVAAPREPFARLLATVDALFDRLHEYHAERTAALDLITKLLACHTQAEVVRVLKRSLRKVFARDGGAVYFAGARKEQHQRVLAWRMGPEHDVARSRPVCFLIAAGDRPLGLLTLRPHASSLDGEGHLLEDKRLLAEVVVKEVAQALVNLELRARLQTLSVRDALTGLYNRRYFDESAARELEAARRRDVPVGLVVFDVDHFKRFNDRHGHRAGDAALRELGQLLQAETRKSDVVCRWGGEEFVLLLPGASAEQARGRAEAILAAARERLIPHDGELLGPMAFSAGAAAWPTHGADLGTVMEAADRALYEAKYGGRDQVRVAPPAPPSERTAAA